LRGLTALESLNLSATKITDRALDAIATLPKLSFLSLDSTQVTADGLMKLRELRKLSQLTVWDVKLSDADLARLHVAMPEVQISAADALGTLSTSLTVEGGSPPEAVGGNWDKAFAQLEKADEKDRSLAVFIAAIVALRQNPDQATDAQKKMVEQWLSAAIQQAPDSWELKLVLADLWGLEGRFDELAKLYRELLAQTELKGHRRAVAQNNLACVLATQGTEKDLAEARTLIDAAVGQLGLITATLDTRGLIHLAQGDAKAAVADFKAAIAQSPTAMNHFHLALAQEKMGETAAAVQAFQKATALKLDVKQLSPAEQRDYQRLKEAATKSGKP
jgi:tetratricopeptide (TPR) repeat protein